MNRDEEAVGDAFRLPPEFAAGAPNRKRNRLALAEYRGAKTYSLTICTADRQQLFVDARLVSHCFQELGRQARVSKALVYAYCFMPDHLHLLIGSDGDDLDLIGFVKLFKQRTGWWYRNEHRGSLKASPTGVIAPPALWQKSYYDHIVRSGVALRTVAEYVLANPVRAGLVADPGRYPFAGSLVWRDFGSQDLSTHLLESVER